VKSALFILKMFRDTVKKLLDEGLSQREDLFLISFDVLSDDTIKIIIDGDNGVLVEDCIFISRAIENNLDREEQDFSLEVLSSGATEPLVNIRQYKKNIGRTLSVKTKENEMIEGVLTQANEDAILLEWKSREPKPVGKGKVTVKKQVEMAYDAILKAQVVIKF
jgi:ribosome maturation factor RimP